MAGLGLRHPGGKVIGHQRRQGQRQGQGAGLGTCLAGQLVKGQALDAQIVLGGNFLRGGQVEAGLRLPAVGDGGGAHFKIALGRGQLLAHRLFLGLDEGHVVLRGQHIKVSLGDPHNQVLLGRGQLGIGQVNLFEALGIGDLVGRAVQGL